MFNFNVIWPLLLLPLLRVTSLSFRSTISAGGRWTIVGKPRHLVTSSWMWHHPLMSHCCDIKHIRLNIFEISVRKTVYGFPVQLFRSHTIHVASTGISNYHQISIAIAFSVKFASIWVIFPPTITLVTHCHVMSHLHLRQTNKNAVCLPPPEEINLYVICFRIAQDDGWWWSPSGLESEWAGSPTGGFGVRIGSGTIARLVEDQHWSL